MSSVEYNANTHDVEERRNDLLVVRDHAVDLVYLALLVLEWDFLTSNGVRLRPADLRHPFCTCPHCAGDVIYVHSMRGVFARRVSGGQFNRAFKRMPQRGELTQLS